MKTQLMWCRALAPLALLPLGQIRAQRNIDLTGKPLATIADPFTRINGARELPGNLAVVTDPMERTVFLADFGRGKATKIGGQGRGPNEYQYPTAPFAAPADASWIVDASQRRALSISSAGRITETRPMPESSDLSRARGVDASGRVYFEGSDFNPNTGRFSDSLNVVRWDPKTNSVEQIARVWGGGRVMIQRKDGPASLAREITPFPHLDAWAVLPDGRVALVRHEPFAIDIVSGPGAIARVITGGPPAIRITAEERDIYRERNTPPRMGAAMVGGGTGPLSQRPQWEDAHFPPVMPPFIASAVHATPDGEIWIGRSFSGKDRTRRYDIYDAAGRLLGSATLRANTAVVGFGAKTVYVARTNPDDDLVYLEKYAR